MNISIEGHNNCLQCVGFFNANALVDYSQKYTEFMKKILIVVAIALPLINGSDTSRIVETYNNGTISSISYHKDSDKGLELIKEETFHFIGSRSMIGTYKNEMRDGEWTYWYENGQIRLNGNYKNGQKDSLWTYWYDNGIISTKYFYDYQTIDGKIIEWHIDKECWDRLGNECECGESWWSECELH